MNATISQPTVAGGRRARRGAFALVITLLILSLLVVVAVSYLSSMVGERQTADAYSAKARAELVAQSGVDSAMAILAESFRDFPDSATVWDNQQSQNTGTPYDKAIVNTPANEGTSLYLRAAPMTATIPPATSGGTSTSATVADPQTGSTATAASDLKGNNPNNPACKNFVLPLISGVPGGRARLVSEKLASTAGNTGMIPPMDLSVSDPVLQKFTDLNVRRYPGDLQGVIGSPPDWATTTPPPVGPKPARARWVDLKAPKTDAQGNPVKDSSGNLIYLQTGRYAFWIEDESFRTNINQTNYDNNNPARATNPDLAATVRADNSPDGKSVIDPVTSLPRSVLPKDMFLAGALAGYPTTVFSPTADAQNVLDTRGVYPASFLPEPLAFTHVANSGGTSLATPAIDGLRYLTTTQSGTLNLTRHGTQRVNLNAASTIDATNPVTMSEIRKLVETIRFHLPNFGQRFYRTNNPFPNYGTLTPTQTGTILNRSADVLSTNAEIYLYKTAANLRDYIDQDDQPTMIRRPLPGATLPTLAPAIAPLLPFGSDGLGSPGTNYMWAQGKDGAPFIQEAMVRYRPAIPDSGEHYTLTTDYYVEVWNMSDHDVIAANFNAPYLRIADQQRWVGSHIASAKASPTSPELPVSGAQPTGSWDLSTDSGLSPGMDSPRDFNMDLVSGVFRGDNPTTPVPATTGIVFKAGSVTVITSDPDFVQYGTHNSPASNSIYPYGGPALSTAGLIPSNVYYCSKQTLMDGSPAQRTFSGMTNVPYQANYLRGIKPVHRAYENASNYLDFEVEIVLGNSLGYLDCATGAFCIAAGKSDTGSNGYNFTWTNPATRKEAHNDYVEGGTLGGNTNTPSELGDPRTNNEQLVITLYNGVSYPAQPDQYRYGSPGSGLTPPFSLGSPNSKYLQPGNFVAQTSPTSNSTTPWGDYFNWTKTTNVVPSYPTADLTADMSPAVIANTPLTSIGQLGDLYDPLRVIGTIGSASIDNSRGGGRTLKIGQRDDRCWYDPSTNANNNTVDSIPASNGWASWRLTDVFCIDNPLELPARININGVARDNGAALRAALTGFRFQPTTQITGSTGRPVDPLIHGTYNLGPNIQLKTSTAPNDRGVQKIVDSIKTRLTTTTPNANTPCGPFFERGEFGELESSAGVALFGKNVSSPYVASNDLVATDAGIGVDLNHTYDRGREELFRRLAELICTRGDTFTVHAVGQSLIQTDPGKPAKITGTHRTRVTFRLVPKVTDPVTKREIDFHPGYVLTPEGTMGTPTKIDDPDAASSKFTDRFLKPDLYDIQILEASSL